MKDHQPGCPRLAFWDAGEWEAPCLCDEEESVSKLDDIVSEAFRRVPLMGKTNFEHEEQLARQAARLAWNAAIEAAAKKCDEWDDYPEVTQVGLNIRKLGEGV